MRFDGINVLVTGAASGIGAAAARRFAQEGAYVAVGDVAADRAREVVEAIRADGGQAQAFHLDVASADGWTEVARQLGDADLRLGVVVNNAYALERAPAHALAEPSWSRQLDVDLTSVYLSARTFMADLIANRGTMVNVGSVHGLIAWEGHPAYAAAKGGVLALTRQLAVEYGPAVRVNAVVPGPVLTPTWDDVADDERERVAGTTALRRLALPAEVASVIAFLASDDASYVTGAQIVVDGGQTITARA